MILALAVAAALASGPLVTVKAGATVCEDVLPFADCFQLDYDMSARMIGRDDQNTRIRTVRNTYIVGNEAVVVEKHGQKAPAVRKRQH